LQYERPRKEDPEVVCPQHVPRGVYSQVLAQRLTETFFEGQRCSICPQTEAIEVLGETYQPNTTLWTCPQCGVWWVYAVRDRTQLQVETERGLGIKAVPDGYVFKGLVYHPDEMRQVLHYRITVVPKASTQITGPKPLTLFDHLLMTDDE
jgi:hypothetical protein